MLPLVLLLAGGGAAYFLLLRPKSPKPPPPEETYQLELTDLVVNLADQGTPHYLSASVGLVIAGVHPEEVVEEHRAQICDAVIMTVTQHTYRDLLPVEGKQLLKDDIKAAVDEALSEQGLTVREVLFTNFLME